MRRICQNSVLTAFELEILDVKEQCTQQMRYMQEALEVFTTTRTFPDVLSDLRKHLYAKRVPKCSFAYDRV